MKYLKYILAISLLIAVGRSRLMACGPFYPEYPGLLNIFRCCTPDLERQWQDGSRFQDYEKEQNCILWQKITSSTIPYSDIEKVVYSARFKDLKNLSNPQLENNKFAQWLSNPKHGEDLEYLLIAKEIEELREYLNDPWYYAYDGDEEHKQLEELIAKCQAYAGSRLTSRYALQLVRLYFASMDYAKCIKLWEDTVSQLPQDIVTDMIASYAGGAYVHTGNRDKAIELYTKSQDIGSLITLKVWDSSEKESDFTDNRVKELEYIFNRFPNSPLLAIRLQEYIRKKESYAYNYKDVNSYEIWQSRRFHYPAYVKTNWDVDSLVANYEYVFYNELLKFAQQAIRSNQCHQKGMWQYAVGYLNYLDGNLVKANSYLSKAECSDATPLLKESIRAFRFLMDAHAANNSDQYKNKLLKDLSWIDQQVANNINLDATDDWQYRNKMNYHFYYWQDVVRKVILGVICPRMEKTGNRILSLQLANYGSNRIYQLSPLYKTYHYGDNDSIDKENYSIIIPIDEDRMSPHTGFNCIDYSNYFFEKINSVEADQAARYADRIDKSQTTLDNFLNERSYTDRDYIYDIVGTLYMREMNYDKAAYWLSKVSTDYQARTNIAKEGYFKLNPFKYQVDKKHYLSDTQDYKLRFAQEMMRLEKMMKSDAEPNRKADCKIRYAIGLRNSFGRCWYLTEYRYDMEYSSGTNGQNWRFGNNPYAQKAYHRVDTLMEEAIAEYTTPEQAAQAQLEMMNYKTIIAQYPDTRVAAFVRSRCDNFYDYSIQHR